MLRFSSLNLYHKVRHLVRQNIEASNHSLLLFSATVQDWGIIVVNVRGVFFCYKYAVDQMIK